MYIPAVNHNWWVVSSHSSVALSSPTTSILYCLVVIHGEGSEFNSGNHQSILLNCNQSRSGLNWRLPRWYGDSKSECVRSSVSWGSECVWEGHECMSPFLHSVLIPECNPKPPWPGHQSAPFVWEPVGLHRDPPPRTPSASSTPWVLGWDPTHHTSRPEREEHGGVGSWKTKNQEVNTFSGDEVEGPCFLWECRAGRLEDPAQQEEGRRGHGRHSNRAVESVEIKKGQKKEKRQWVFTKWTWGVRHA